MEAEIESIEVVVRRKDGTSFTLDFTQGAAYLEVETEYDEPEQDSRSFDHLMSAMDQIIAHLEAQQASPQPATAPPAAQQGERGHRDGGEAVQAAMAVLRDEGSDSEGGWHSWRCFDRERYPEPCDCTEQVARAAIAAAEPHIRADLAAHDAEVRAQALAPIREALAGHPRCDIHPDDDPITCGWKRAVFDVQSTLDRQIERGE